MDRELKIPPWRYDLHFFDGTKKSVNYVLVLDALNFSFWANPGSPRWCVEYEGESLQGYWALAASLKRAINEGFPLWDAAWLAQISREEVAHILRGSAEIPLRDERLQNLHEIGSGLLREYGGWFSGMVERAGGSAEMLVAGIAEAFSSFRDMACYDGEEVVFLKRAQIAVSDLAASFGGRGWGKFSDLDELTAFADYKIPQVLRRLGILEYSPSLGTLVDSRTLLPAGSPQEVEIRAATIWAVEMLKKELLDLGRRMSSIELDWLLWNIGQIPHPEDRPYHLTRTIFY